MAKKRKQPKPPKLDASWCERLMHSLDVHRYCMYSGETYTERKKRLRNQNPFEQMGEFIDMNLNGYFMGAGYTPQHNSTIDAEYTEVTDPQSATVPDIVLESGINMQPEILKKMGKLKKDFEADDAIKKANKYYKQQAKESMGANGNKKEEPRVATNKDGVPYNYIYDHSTGEHSLIIDTDYDEIETTPGAGDVFLHRGFYSTGFVQMQKTLT